MAMNNHRSRRARPELSQNWRRPDPFVSISATISNQTPAILPRQSNVAEVNTNTILRPEPSRKGARPWACNRDILSRGTYAPQPSPRRENIIEESPDSNSDPKTPPRGPNAIKRNTEPCAGPKARHENTSCQQVLDPDSFSRGRQTPVPGGPNAISTDTNTIAPPETSNNNAHRQIDRRRNTTATGPHRLPIAPENTTTQSAPNYERCDVPVYEWDYYNREAPKQKIPEPVVGPVQEPKCYKCHGELNQHLVCQHCKEDNMGKRLHVMKWLSNIDNEHDETGKKIAKQVQKAKGDNPTVANFQFVGVRAESFELISMAFELISMARDEAEVSVSPITATNLDIDDEGSRRPVVNLPGTDSRSDIKILSHKARRILNARLKKSQRWRRNHHEHVRLTDESMEQTVENLYDYPQLTTVKFPMADSRTPARYVNHVLIG